ncbi:SGNH/GDSL hydrolase family protein [Mangrovibrevibacter kandeliae]|uniref:SGNH/GDSL hydrolase family protein n=1 Tax=Mangrovibrevibacter kandeliae TaxID=2968473 RepID=UPI002117D867|nr:DUF459 domain-containing protein [Aurantimonas sp. CSK15Z-1]MCQ8783279.1 DUF459 domain-containing protein [Aurantimonas sp. CSK15Z-1]
MAASRTLPHTKPVTRLLALLLVVPLALDTGLLVPAARAVAQERPRTIMDMLFGGSARQARPGQPGAPEPRRIRKKAPKRVKAPAGSSSATAASAAVDAADAAPVEKVADAKAVLVVGDFMASALATGLADAFSDDANVRIVDRTDGSSGLVRDDHYDWLAEIGPLIDEVKPALVVVMLGSNDRQPIQSGAETLDLRSDRWSSAYGRRAETLAKAIRGRDVPLVWVGMPSFKSERMSEDMVYLNGVYMTAATTAGGEFVDVWDGFVDSSGAFALSGPDTDGQPARLRNSDGITMTDAGRNKLAFFAEKPILRLLGDAGAPGAVAALPNGEAPGFGLPPLAAVANQTSTPAMALNDPALDGGEILLGGPARAVPALEPSPRERLISGMANPGVEGRADDFDWNRKTEAVSAGRDPAIVKRGSVALDTLRGTGEPVPPKPMPSLQDAIIDDWLNNPQAAPPADAAAAAAAPSEPAQPPRAEPPQSAAPPGLERGPEG